MVGILLVVGGLPGVETEGCSVLLSLPPQALRINESPNAVAPAKFFKSCIADPVLGCFVYTRKHEGFTAEVNFSRILAGHVGHFEMSIIG
jgi:hypothetical protein